MWTLSTQLNMEVYGARSRAFPIDPFSVSAEDVLAALWNGGITHYICFEEGRWHDVLHQKWKELCSGQGNRALQPQESANREDQSGFAKLIKIRDFQCPEKRALKEFVSTLQNIATANANNVRSGGQGFKVFVHCTGGAGRTGFSDMVLKRLYSSYDGWTF